MALLIITAKVITLAMLTLAVKHLKSIPRPPLARHGCANDVAISVARFYRLLDL